MSYYQFILIFIPGFCIYVGFVCVIFSLGMYSRLAKGAEATMFKTLLKLSCNISVPPLLRCSLLSFKSWHFKVLDRSINKKLFQKKILVKHLFTSFAFGIKQSLCVMMFELVISCLCFLN